MMTALGHRIGGEGCILTSSGAWIEPLHPDPKDIDIETIAHHLSNQCRFTGATKSFYSVAQHSCLVSDLCIEYPLDGLLHDASEAYLSDIARPIKSQREFGAVYKRVENRLMEAVADRFGLQWPMPEEVKTADNILLFTEARDLMPPAFLDEVNVEGAVFLPKRLKTWSPSRAKQEFLERFEELK